MKRLIICNTLYHIIVILQMRMTIWQNEGRDTDVILTDKIPSSKELSNRLQKTKLFANVFSMNVRYLDFSKGKKFHLSGIFEYYVKKENGDILEKLVHNKYQEYCFANIGEISLSLGEYLLKKNKRMNMLMFEDGSSSYSREYGKAILNITKWYRTIRKILFRDIRGYVKKYYVFNPELVLFKDHAKEIDIRSIPSLLTNKERIKKYLNNLFLFYEMKDKYEEKVIFFEEAYFEDGIEVGDIHLVENLAREFGKDNIIIKTHPRNSRNRFAELGYKTNKEKAMPWEVIALNIPLEEKLLVTISSTAVINTRIMFGERVKIRFEYNNISIKNEHLNSLIEVVKEVEGNDK